MITPASPPIRAISSRDSARIFRLILRSFHVWAIPPSEAHFRPAPHLCPLSYSHRVLCASSYDPLTKCSGVAGEHQWLPWRPVCDRSGIEEAGGGGGGGGGG